MLLYCLCFSGGIKCQILTNLMCCAYFFHLLSEFDIITSDSGGLLILIHLHVSNIRIVHTFCFIVSFSAQRPTVDS